MPIIKPVSDEEMLEKWASIWKEQNNTDWGDLNEDDPEMVKGLVSLATHFKKEGAKEVVEWLFSRCVEHTVPERKVLRFDCILCIDDLKKELGL